MDESGLHSISMQVKLNRYNEKTLKALVKITLRSVSAEANLQLQTVLAQITKTQKIKRKNDEE